jgi:hypothetical protein
MEKQGRVLLGGDGGDGDGDSDDDDKNNENEFKSCGDRPAFSRRI